MSRWVCLFILLPLYVLGQADVEDVDRSTSLFPTDQPIWEDTPATTILPTTKGSDNAVAVITTTTTPEPDVPITTTFQPTPDSDAEGTTQQSNVTTVAPTTPLQLINSTTALPTPLPTNSTTALPTPLPTNSTTALPTPLPTNSTTALPTPLPTNSTTALPTPLPTNSTTALPTPLPTNSTTALPTPLPTNSTTALPTPLPTNSTTTPLPTNSTTASAPTTIPLPKVGDYVVRAEWNSSACLMARMGLQFSFRMGDSFQTINLDPNVTTTNGTCGNNDSTLMLRADTTIVQFIFTNQTSKFFLSALTLTVLAGSGVSFKDGSSNLSLWEASLGSSYMCKKEQSFNITENLILNTFELQVQPFGVMNDQFNTAEDCKADEAENFIVPIAVGVALIVLVLLVLVAYLIGRHRSRVTSYEQFS
ncbi:lysosome-associated membrane glycoprotein 2 isoform X2 [Ictalurus punctatus]|uniref:Lysosome-associated membrane glycoprotein 2 isoform X2 n=1 Tax=Ictalurus punctatus TaxID=7998 RepID=A0A9F7R9S1_ICTPU|nr:lysosome-associated membrane glycoprotein 2 isoform X2 [Ictalurus punctatus]